MDDIRSPENPYIHAPQYWAEKGLPYGAWCKCSKCGYVGTSTFSFDYYSEDGAGTPLKCESCALGRHTGDLGDMMAKFSTDTLKKESEQN